MKTTKNKTTTTAATTAKRTDLICESGIIEDEVFGTGVHRETINGTRVEWMSVNADAERKYGVKQGSYITLFTESGNVKACLTELIGGLLTEGTVLVAGLGNEHISSDSLGVKCLRYIPATAHLSAHPDFAQLGMRRVCAAEAGVTGKTGIESSERIACLAKHIGASMIIAIDSLACSGTDRLCTTIQLTDTGISPGSGVGNDRSALNSETAGVPVVAVGVPTVIDLADADGNETERGLMVTPRAIDVITDRLSRTIGTAVSLALNPSLSEDEIMSLII